MCCNRSLNNKINRLHERSLRIVYSDKTSDFSELLEKDGSVSIHYQNIRQLAIEMFKVSKGLCPEIVKGLFQFRYDIPYNLRQRSQFHISPVRTVFSGTESIKYPVPKIWELIPDEMKELESPWEFKRAIKLWKPTSCPCRLCKQHRDWFSFSVKFLNKVFYFINNNFLQYQKIYSKILFVCFNIFVNY